MAAFALDDYDYHLPPELIAQQPAPQRDASRLLVCDVRRDSTLADRRFPGLLSLLAPGDLLVFNDTRVFPARLPGRKESGGKIELTLLEYPRPAKAAAAGQAAQAAPQDLVATAGAMPAALADHQNMVCSEPCWALLKSSKGPKVGGRLHFGPDCRAEVLALGDGGKVQVRLEVAPARGQDSAARLAATLARYGRMPLPPYIRRPEENEEDQRRYQTVYAQAPGAVAAPTAGLHFTEDLLAKIQAMGVRLTLITLHVGYGTFAPVRSQDIRDHEIHAEDYLVSQESAALVNQTRAAGGRIWAVGTTSVRTLEAAAGEDGRISPGGGRCRLYIYPGYSFKVVDNLLTNFHLPRSSLLFLVSALAGRQNILRAYHHAVAERYRFFSYGDAMAIIKK